MASPILEHGLKNANEYWGTEVPLYYSGLYAGTTDPVGLHNDILLLWILNKQINPKKTEWIEDYFLQLCVHVLHIITCMILR